MNQQKVVFKVFIFEGYTDRVQINALWFGKYDAFYIFHDTVFPTYPENHDTK